MELADLVAGRLGRRGTLVALESGSRNWTYPELDQITARRAAQLRRLCPEGGRVVLIGDHTAEALIWALAVMRSGLVHTPLNPVLPQARMHAAIRLAAPSLVLRCLPDSQAALAKLSPAVRVLSAGEVAAAAEAAEAVADTGTAPAARIAYSIFTSGSTGVPKLVNVGQAGIENLCRSQARIFGVKLGDRVLQFSSLSFDASIAEILVALYAGARLVVPPRDRGSWLGVVREYLRKNGCDLITLPPSVYSQLDDEARKAIGTVVFAGEALSEVEFRAAARYSRVLNAYGPTEGTVCFSIAELSDFTTSIGRPIEGFTARVYDRDQGSYARSGRGELVLVGQGVALGYEGLSALPSGEASPFTTVDDAPAYHSGDHVELSDGELFYLGRQDEQVKRLGHRIELAELSGRIAGLLDAPVMLLPDGTSLVLAHTAIASPEAELKARLREHLPPWEVPDVLLPLPELPLTDNGKADKAAVLALLEQARPVSDDGGNDGNDAEVVQAVVADVLGPGIDPAISIFDAGADSLALVRIQVKLSEIYGEDLVQSIFDRLNYDFSVTSFVAGLRGEAQDEGETRDHEPAPSAYATISAELAGLPAALSALRPSPAPAPARQAGRRQAVTLTGASGFIGGHLLDRLLGEGRRLTVITTSDPAKLVAAHCTRFERDPADLGDVEFLSYEDTELLARSPAGDPGSRWGPVVHCGFEVNHLLPLTRQLNGSITSTRTVVRAAAALEAPRFVFLSAASAGPRFLPLTEPALDALRDDPYSQSKLVAEEYARALTGERCRVDLLRAGLVYGHTSREQAFLRQDVFAQLLALSLRHGALPRFQGYVPVCHVDDVVTALLAAAGSADAAQASVLVQRTYSLPDLLDELDLRTDQVADPQDWLSAVTRSQAAEPSLLAALRQWLSATGWSEQVRGTGRPVIAELRQRHLKIGS